MDSRIPGFYDLSVAERTGGEVSLRILSNLADRRLARARCTVAPETLAREDGPEGAAVRDRIVDAWGFAAAAGAGPEEVDDVAARMVAEGEIRESRAREILDDA